MKKTPSLLDNAVTYWPIISAIVGLIAWGVRLESKTSDSTALSAEHHDVSTKEIDLLEHQVIRLNALEEAREKACK